MTTGRERDLRVLRRKRDATRYRILVEIAERQPAVSQREVAEAIGVTAQAVSEYVGELVEEGYVETRGRGRYRVTKEGVDWLISRTDELRAFADHVAEEVVGGVEVEAAIADAPIAEGDRVALSMHDGTLHAAPVESEGFADGATAIAVSDADAGEAIGVTDFEGLLDYDPGVVTILAVPPVPGHAENGPERVADLADGHDLLAVAGAEALALARAAGREPDLRFGTPTAVREAAVRGLSVLVVAVETAVSAHADRLREQGLGYEVVDPSEGRAGW